MVKNKFERSLDLVGQSQHATEQTTTDKFTSVQDLVQSSSFLVDKSKQVEGRVSPQLSCTIAPEDKELLNALTLYASNKVGKVLNTSILIRSLIRLGDKYREELEL